MKYTYLRQFLIIFNPAKLTCLILCMKLILRSLLALSLCLTIQTAFAQKTTVYVVRHAEKDANDANKADPELSDIGKQRAAALAEELKKVKFDEVYATNYKRTKNTVAAVAANSGVEVKTYSPNDVAKLKEAIKGKTVLIAGHSNTVLALLRELGATIERKDLTDADYDFLFKLVTKGEGNIKLETTHYGVKNHSTTDL